MKFSLKARYNSFGFAFQGLRSLLRTEHNTWIHAVLTLTVIIMAAVYEFSRMEWVVLVILIGQVWIVETINTAIEKSMDFVSKERHPQIKLVKDLAAGAVLISALVAVIGGVVLFWEKIFN